MKAYFLTILLLLSPVAYAQDMPWQMKDGESSMNFSVIIEGIASDGEFTKFTADIIFDPVSLDQSRIDILIDLDHIESFYSDVAINLKKKNWFVYFT